MSANQPFLISVVIPTRNRLGLVMDALQGLSLQTLPKEVFEVIVVDNGSTDGTFDALSKAAGSFAFKLRVVKSPETEKGPAPARNFGVECASAPLVAFTDSDCRPDPEWLSNIIDVAGKNPSAAFIAGKVLLKPEQASDSFFVRRTVTCEAEHPTYPTANICYRREVFLAFKGFNEALSFPNIMGQSVEAADTDLAWRVKSSGQETLFSDKSVVYHEVQTLPWGEWLMEPLRLFLLPALVKMHPGLRNQLLTTGIFFYVPSIAYYLVFFIAVLLLFRAPHLLLWAPLGLLVLATLKSKNKAPLSVLEKAWHIVLNASRIYIMSSALIYGSIKYRSLVL